MGNQITDNLNPQMDAFLQDVAQGIWGDSRLSYGDVIKYSKKATEQDIEQLEDFYWDWTSKLTEDDEIDIQELEQHIYDVINGA